MKSFPGYTFQKEAVLNSKRQLRMRILHTSVREDTKMNIPWKIIWTGLDSLMESRNVPDERFRTI
ncbi:MAG: hypothetical protein WCF23_00100 [Candidatus Nitrosopolaris sp.]